MECEKIKQIIPNYFQHTASEEEIQIVEEHLCVCHECRTTLGELMDKMSDAGELTPNKSEPVPVDNQPNLDQEEPLNSKFQGEKAVSEAKPDIEYFPGEGLEEDSQELDKSAEKIEEPVKEEPVSLESKPELEPEKTEEVVEEELIFKDEEPVVMSEPEPLIPESISQEIYEPVINKKEEISPLPEEQEIAEPAKERGDYSLDRYPLEEDGVGPIEYFYVLIGVGVLVFLLYLLIKG